MKITSTDLKQNKIKEQMEKLLLELVEKRGKHSTLWMYPKSESLTVAVDQLYSLYQEGREEGIRQVGKWIKFPYRKGMVSVTVKGLGTSKGGGCEVCGGKLVYIRGQYPEMKKRKVCPTCATEIIESLNSNCNNRDAAELLSTLGKQT
jgi:hypothetical protein